MLLSQDRIIIIFTVFEINSIALAKIVFETNAIEKLVNYTIGLCDKYMHISSLVFVRQVYILKNLVTTIKQDCSILRYLVHYDDVIMGEIASQITSLTVVYSAVYSGSDQSKHQSSASLAFVWGIHRGPVNSPHKWPVTRKMFPFDDVIM